jgi:hypothetical protein
VNQGYVDKESLSEVFEFDERQSDYYGNAARFLGFLDRKDKEFLLTNEGKRLIQLKSPYERASLVVSQLVMRPVFHQIFQKLLYYDLDFDLLDSINISQIIADNTALTGKTPARRASTVKQWIRWISTYAA